MNWQKSVAFFLILILFLLLFIEIKKSILRSLFFEIPGGFNFSKKIFLSFFWNLKIRCIVFLPVNRSLESNTKGVKPMTFRKNMHDGIKVSEIEERRYGLK